MKGTSLIPYIDILIFLSSLLTKNWPAPPLISPSQHLPRASQPLSPCLFALCQSIHRPKAKQPFSNTNLMLALLASVSSRAPYCPQNKVNPFDMSSRIYVACSYPPSALYLHCSPSRSAELLTGTERPWKPNSLPKHLIAISTSALFCTGDGFYHSFYAHRGCYSRSVSIYLSLTSLDFPDSPVWGSLSLDPRFYNTYTVLLSLLQTEFL